MSSYTQYQKDFYERNKEDRKKYYKAYYRKHRTPKDNSLTLPRSNLTFPTQIKLKAYTMSECLKELDILINADHHLYPFLLDMWEREPDKTVIDDIEFKCISRPNRKAFRTYFKTEDRPWRSFSLLRKCVRGK